jgi:hypothetical protein
VLVLLALVLLLASFGTQVAAIKRQRRRSRG